MVEIFKELVQPYVISVVIPVYGAKDSLPFLYQRLKSVLSQLTEKYEIIFVNDACPQNSWDIIVQLSKQDPQVKGINLSRNFGQHYAITAGLDHVQGKWVVVMDCDLQDQPEEIINLYNKAQEGFDVVLGKRLERKDHVLKRFSSKLFYSILGYFTDLEYDGTIANFGIYSYRVIQSVNLYREHSRAFPLFVHIVGFKSTSIPIIHAKRESGTSSYSLSKLINLAIDSIVTHSNKPLRISIKFGSLISLLSIGYAIWLIVRNLVFGVPIPGWTSLMVSLFFMFGILFAVLGVLGLYIGKIFDETKGRPLYLIQETINFIEG